MRQTVLLLCLLFPLAAQADGPLDWYLRQNGWGWSNGYHANNNCAKVGHNQWAPMNGGGPVYTGDSGIRGCGGPPGPMSTGYGAGPQFHYQPTPAPPAPEQVPAGQRPMRGVPMKGPMTGPMMNSPSMPDQEAYRPSWMGVRY